MINPRLCSVSRPGVPLGRRLSFAALAIAVLALPGRADVIILKDGYAIHGKVLAEQTIVDDPNGQQIIVPKLKGLSMVDDGPRLTVFSPNYKRVGDVDPQNKFAAFVNVTRPIIRKTTYPAPAIVQIDAETPFSDRWLRTLTVKNFQPPFSPYKVEQQVEVITPHFMRLNSITHNWLSYFLTQEKGSDLVRKLLSTHPDFVERPMMPDAGKRSKLIRFLVQAGWLSEAEEEIERLLKDLPGETKKAEEHREEIRLIRLDQLVADVERAKESGQHDGARKLLATFPKDKAPANLTIKVAKLRAEYDSAANRLDKARRLLGDLLKLVDGAKFKDLFAAVGFINEELHLDTASRLELFITLAEQAERARLAGKPPLHTPEKLMAAAASAWLLGNNSTVTDIDIARKRIKARDLALNYLRETVPQRRQQLLNEYGKDSEALPFDELEMLISLLPPPEAEKTLSNTAMDKKIALVPGVVGGLKYLLKLPPEYQHGRAYPLLIVLPNAGERPNDTLKRFGDWPGKFGYIVAVLDWGAGFRNTYTYSDEEQNMVTGLLRHLRRTLQVDSDKVFLFGEGEGAGFALDMGATQPDLFAGVVPMNPNPEAMFYQVFEFWKNFQNLPVYMVVGDRTGEASKTIRMILTQWMARGYPSLAVSYKGRGAEFFSEELPYIFDWMSRKTRPTAFPDLGSAGQEFRTVRTVSNHFYWISTDEIEPASLYDPMRKTKAPNPATLQAKFSEGNLITVNAMRVKQVSIWLGKGTVDFSKPVFVTIKDRGSTWKKELTPKLAVLLEDLHARGDRQRPFYQRIDCIDLKGIPKFSGQ